MADARVNHFLNQNNVVYDLPSMNKASLVLRDDGWQHHFNPVGYNLGDDFVTDIIERDVSEFVEGCSPFLFRDERKES